MWIKKIKQRKLQYFVIAMIIMMATGVFVGCLSFAVETQRYVDEYYDADNCPITFDVLFSNEGEKLLKENKEMMELINYIEISMAKVIEKDYYHDGAKVAKGAGIIYEISNKNSLRYPLEILEGEEVPFPGKDELWITNIYANAVNLELGDKLTFGESGSKEYTISAIVRTPQCSSGFIDNYPCFMNKTTLEEAEGTSVYSYFLYAVNNDVTLHDLKQVIPTEYSKL
jgi:putative ABC transport system permease protein